MFTDRKKVTIIYFKYMIKKHEVRHTMFTRDKTYNNICNTCIL